MSATGLRRQLGGIQLKQMQFVKEPCDVHDLPRRAITAIEMPKGNDTTARSERTSSQRDRVNHALSGSWKARCRLIVPDPATPPGVPLVAGVRVGDCALLNPRMTRVWCPRFRCMALPQILRFDHRLDAPT